MADHADHELDEKKVWEVSEIQGLVATVRDAELNLHKRFEADYEKMVGVQFEVEEGDEAFTDNACQMIADKVTDMCAKAELKIEVPIEKQGKPKRKQDAEHERFVRGALLENDKQLMARIQPALQNQLAWHVNYRGWGVVKALVYKGDDDKTVFDVEAWDRRWVTYRLGKTGLDWICLETHITAEDARGDYGLDEQSVRSGLDNVVFNFWTNEIKAVIINDQWHKEQEEHQIGHIPIRVFPVGSMPMIHAHFLPPGENQKQGTIQYQGESIISGIRNMHEPFSKLMSAVLTMIDRNKGGAYTAESKEGDFIPEEYPGQTKVVTPLSTDDEQKLAALDTPKMPPDTTFAITVLEQKKQQGGMSGVAMGDNLNSNQSGIAVSRLLHEFYTVTDRRTKTMADMYEFIAHELTYQYSSSGMVEGSGLDGVEFRVREKKTTSMAKFTPEDIKPTEFQANLSLDLPQDQAGKLAIAQMMRDIKATGTPLFSDLSVHDWLETEDPDLEKDKITAQKFLTMPLIEMKNGVAALLEQGEETAAFIVMLEAMKMEQQMMMEAQNMMNAGAPGQGAPQGQPGLQEGGPQGLPPPGLGAGI